LRMSKFKIVAMAIGLGALSSVSASAAVAPAPSHIPKPSAVVNTSALGIVAQSGQKLATSNVEQVQRRGRSARRDGPSFRDGRSARSRSFRGGRSYRGRNYRRGRSWAGPAIATGIAALIIGGSIAQSQARYGDRWSRCDARFRSFRWSDGTYQPYGGGPRMLCPYLRR
jgi:hypothetical protein